MEAFKMEANRLKGQFSRVMNQRKWCSEQNPILGEHSNTQNLKQI